MPNMWDENSDFYNLFAYTEMEDTRTYLDVIGVQEGQSVLDVCCGPGRISIAAAERGAQVTGIDSSSKMLEHARANARERGLEDHVTFKLVDWNHVMPGQNVAKHDVVIASRCVAMMDVEKLSACAKQIAAVQIFADAPSLPDLIGALLDGCGDEQPELPGMRQERVAGPGAPGAPRRTVDEPGHHGPEVQGHGPGQGGPGADNGLGIYLTIASRAHGAGFDPNVRILPERFRKTFSSFEEAVAWVCSLNPARSKGFEERVALNVEPFTHESADGIEFCITTAAALIWWDVRGPARWIFV